MEKDNVICSGGSGGGKLKEMVEELKADQEEVRKYREIGTLEEVREAVEKQKHGWIPVEERLPEKEYDTVLCVTDRNHYFVGVYNQEYGFRTGDIDAEGEVSAWRPLPDPYQSEREGGKPNETQANRA